MSAERYVVGLDVGTTAIKACVVSSSSEVIRHATVPIRLIPRRGNKDEVSVECILDAVQVALHKLDLSSLPPSSVAAIAICGQMHGIVWWSAKDIAAAASDYFCSIVSPSSSSDRPASSSWSSLITWQDGRCDRSFLDQRRACLGHCSPLSSGYGLASFSHVVENELPGVLSPFDTCGTIMDLVAFVLCGHTTHEQATIDLTNAFSWGGFDLSTQSWPTSVINALGIPQEVLPAAKAPGSVVGFVGGAASADFGLPVNVPVFVPMGDHQCSIHALLESQALSPLDTAMINIGTSAQLSLVVHDDVAISILSSSSRSVEVRPFLTNEKLVVAAALTGGNVFALFVEMCQAWRTALGDSAPLDKSDLYERAINSGMAKLDTTLQCQPTFAGERADNVDYGMLSNMMVDNWTLSDMSAAIARGIVENLVGLCPQEMQGEFTGRRLLGSGNALLQNALLQHYVAKRFDQMPTLCQTSDACVGAGMFVWRQLRQKC
ncbi:unnamed protein product [Aphanomyces euteiches]|uniref:Carbohydrate kinase FGGY N-terminal domain-containing protein n=1 Tax=Aphanomyces euteiches TaxID=100861 RepID=A0A6G0XTY7_9STRA|nr:hypothetical protein Ae201684_001252 [Aphanomyces euteiches]KAH9099600.1 hypothetical protein Ae201684P_018613 [Aphanomyces euteiches]KAH9155765.1 hypothetical protein AeRB84_002294 [Aphanomyces euteiches]